MKKVTCKSSLFEKNLIVVICAEVRQLNDKAGTDDAVQNTFRSKKSM